jgi:S-DNA-T family DNA segregation ATPase FtsK/SpoIIIE
MYAQVELTRAKTDTERARRDAVQVVTRVKAAHELLKIDAARKAALEEQPYLGGVTGEERAIRKAVWEVHEVQLLTCDVTMTRTGWTAVVGLPAALSRDAARTSWPKVASAMRLDGRMKAADGQRTNELAVSFVDNAKTGLESLTGWHPGAAWAVVADTGETVPVPLGRRILFAGCSGSGKSWSARPLMAEASEYDDHRLIVIDLKVTEARNWQHRARIATEADQIDQVTAELISEGERRLKLIPRGRDTIEISPDMPRITVFVDEGGELLSALDESVIERLRTIARKYRAAEIVLVWCTQKPSLSGNGHGLDSQISAQLTHKLSLTAATPSESRVIFGEDAGDKGWDAHELPLKGWALLRDIETQAEPARLRMRAMSPTDVIALPDRPVWFPDGDRWFSGDEQYQGQAAPVAGDSDGEDAAIRRMLADGKSQRTIADVLGWSVGKVNSRVAGLREGPLGD